MCRAEIADVGGGVSRFVVLAAFFKVDKMLQVASRGRLKSGAVADRGLVSEGGVEDQVICGKEEKVHQAKRKGE